MKFDSDALNKIYDRTAGRCHLCHARLAFKNYGLLDARSSWEVEHSNPQANGGTHHLNNLYAACIPCNRSKGARSTRSVRAKNGLTRAPLSTKARERIRTENTFLGAGGCAMIGAALAGPPGAVVGVVVGALLGESIEPRR